jgi:endonuclease-3
MRETLALKAVRARHVVDRLGACFPEATTALDFGSPLQLMVAVILSAQCTDVRVNQVTPALFARFPGVSDFARAEPRQVEPFVKSCGLYRNKSRSIVAACRAIVAGGGEVPTSRAALVELPGIGNKSAGVIAMHLSDDEKALPVDTHVTRLAHRLDLSRRERPDDIERDLQALLPPHLWKAAHHRLIWHGRKICSARRPLCDECPVRSLCPRRGVR